MGTPCWSDNPRVQISLSTATDSPSALPRIRKQNDYHFPLFLSVNTYSTISKLPGQTATRFIDHDLWNHCSEKFSTMLKFNRPVCFMFRLLLQLQLSITSCLQTACHHASFTGSFWSLARWFHNHGGLFSLLVSYSERASKQPVLELRQYVTPHKVNGQTCSPRGVQSGWKWSKYQMKRNTGELNILSSRNSSHTFLSAGIKQWNFIHYWWC